MLSLGRLHEQIVDAIQILRIEEADFDLASAVVGRLKYLHLCTQNSS